MSAHCCGCVGFCVRDEVVTGKVSSSSSTLDATANYFQFLKANAMFPTEISYQWNEEAKVFNYTDPTQNP